MLQTTLDDILTRLRDHLEQDDFAGAVILVESLRAPDQAELFAELDNKQQAALLPQLNPGDSADILEKLDDEESAELAASLHPEALTRIVDEMEPDEAAVVSLAFFIPLLIGTGGNAGSQTTSTIIRALAVDELDKKGWLKPLWHELRVGLLLGVAVGVVAYGRALLWDTGEKVALTVAIALFAIVVWANILGSVLPLAARELKIDPAVVSGPAMSTLVDATGLFIYFSITGILLGM